MTNKRLRQDVLRSVSRSFYLSLRLLPRGLREPISLAYLLARATDTIADTTEIPVATRLQTLAGLEAAIQGSAPHEEFRQAGEEFSGHQKDDAERTLIESLPLCFAWLDSLGEADRADVREVLLKIARGQTLDLERFAEPAMIRALQTAAELDEYTYLVAGCVGEFWTRICSRHLPKFSQKEEVEMQQLGVLYGQGLQLVNILRDLGADLRAGRCYLPANELSAVGIAPERLAEMPEGVAPILDGWRQKAEAGMLAGLEYAAAIRDWRVRVAAVLPALIGIRTLELLSEAGVKSIGERVKVPRGEVSRLVLLTLLSRGSPRCLRRHSERSRGIA